MLICNGDVISGQRENFSYELIFKDLYDIYQDCAFLFTSKINEIKARNSRKTISCPDNSSAYLNKLIDR